MPKPRPTTEAWSRYFETFLANTGKGEPRVTAKAIPASRATAVGRKNEAAKSATKSIRAAHWRAWRVPVDTRAACTAGVTDVEDVAVVFMPQKYNTRCKTSQHTYLYGITICYTPPPHILRELHVIFQSDINQDIIKRSAFLTTSETPENCTLLCRSLTIKHLQKAMHFS